MSECVCGCVCAQVSVVCVCVHSVYLTTTTKYLLSVRDAPETVLDAWDTSANKMKVPTLKKLTFNRDYIPVGVDMCVYESVVHSYVKEEGECPG